MADKLTSVNKRDLLPAELDLDRLQWSTLL